MDKKEELIQHLSDNVGYTFQSFILGKVNDVATAEAINKLTDALRLCGCEYSNHLYLLMMQGLFVEMKKSCEDKPEHSYVYALHSESSGLTKIGYSARFDERMREITHMNSEDLRLILKIPGGAKLESLLHKKFKARRKHGEWFMLSPEEVSRLPKIAASL